MPIPRLKRLRIKLTPYQRLPRLGMATRAFALAEYSHKEKKIPPTSGKKAILKHGKTFMETFPEEQTKGEKGSILRITAGVAEGHHPVEIRIEHVWKYRRGENVASLKLGFTRDSVIVNTIQGTAGAKEKMNEFERETNRRWADALFQRIEEHASACGFSFVKILRPEFIYYFHLTGKGNPKSKEIQEHMKSLYYTIAHHLGYKKEGKYLVKRVG